MARQSSNDRLDESLGMRRGPERDFKQSMKDRRDESRADRSGMKSGGKFDVPDNKQAWEVRSLNTNSEQYDLDRIKPYNNGSKGYPAEAWNYKY